MSLEQLLNVIFVCDSCKEVYFGNRRGEEATQMEARYQGITGDLALSEVD